VLPVPLLVLLRIPLLKLASLVLLMLLLLQLLLGMPAPFLLLFCGGQLVMRVSGALVELNSLRQIARILRVLGMVLVERRLLGLTGWCFLLRHG
jgi:hypothetical protein